MAVTTPLGPRQSPVAGARDLRGFHVDGFRLLADIEDSMEAPTEVAPPRPRFRRRKLIAILAAVAVAAAAFAAWEILRARSIGEVYAMSHLSAGAQIPLQGTITGVARENTSYGPRVYLQLDHSTVCGGPASGDVLGDPNASYRIGDSYGTTLHLQSFTINGDPAVWTPQLVCHFPALESRSDLVCRLLLEKKKKIMMRQT